MQFKVLEEKAVSADLFEGKPHERVASTLFNLINEESKGLTIGLEGGWGSGKSTVISILKGKFESNKEIGAKYFYFDAWAHEGDPLRRIFLESFAKQFRTKKDDDLDKISQKISNRLKIVKTTSRQQVTNLGKWLAFAALLVPFGTTLTSSLAKEHPITIGWFLPVCWPVLISLTIAIAPFLVLIGNGVRIFCRQLCKKEHSSFWAASNWMFLQGESTQTSTQEISDDSERSSIEFEKAFTAMLEIVFSDETIKKLILIIDNLDRIAPEDTLKIWATLQTFFQYRNPEGNEHDEKRDNYSKLWVIVPYDPDGLRKVWDKKSPATRTTSEAHLEAQDHHSCNGHQHECSKSFFGKCFQLRIDVPALILSGWEKFMRECMNEGLAGWTDTDREAVLDVMRWTRTRANDAPSPREIKNYINQIGFLKSHAHESISIKACALYTIWKYVKFYDNSEVENNLIRRSVTKELGNFFDENIEKELAGLLYGVSAQKGIELLLEKDIVDALESNVADKLEQLEKDHKGAFWTVFNLIISKLTDLQKMLIYTRNVEKVLWNNGKLKLDPFVNRIRDVFAENKPYLDQKTLIDTGKWKSFIRIVCEAGKFKPQNIAQSFSNAIGEAMISSVMATEISKMLEEMFGNYVVDISGIEIPDVPLIEWLKWVRSGNPMMYKLKPSNKILNELAETIKEATPIEASVSKCVEFLSVQGVKDFTAIQMNLLKHIKHNTGNQPNYSVETAQLIVSLQKVASNLVEPILKAGELYNWFYLHKRSDPEVTRRLAYAAGCCFKTKLFEPLAINAIGNSNQGLDALRSFWKASNQENAKFIWEISKNNDSLDVIWNLSTLKELCLIKDILKLAIDEESEEFFGFEDGLDSLERCLNHFELHSKEIDSVCRLLISHSDIEDCIKKVDNIDTKAQILLPLAKIDEAVEIRKHIHKTLSNVEGGVWSDSFSEKNKVIDLAVKLHEKDSKLTFDHNLMTALEQKAKGMIVDGVFPSDEISKIKEWSNLLSKGSLRKLKKEIGKDLLEFWKKEEYRSVECWLDFAIFDQISERSMNHVPIIIAEMTKDSAASPKNSFLVTWLAFLYKANNDMKLTVEVEEKELLIITLRSLQQDAKTTEDAKLVASKLCINLDEKSEEVAVECATQSV